MVIFCCLDAVNSVLIRSYCTQTSRVYMGAIANNERTHPFVKLNSEWCFLAGMQHATPKVTLYQQKQWTEGTPRHDRLY
jgi:hypothetical protein